MAIVTFFNKINELGIKLWLDNGQLKFKAPKGTWNDEIRDQLLANKGEVIAFLEKQGKYNKTAEVPPILPVSRVYQGGKVIERFPLSFSQERLWFIDLMEPGSVSYNIPWQLDIQSEPGEEFNTSHIEQAFNLIIRRHENLRTIFPSHNGKVYQQVLEESQLELKPVDLSHFEVEEERYQELQRLCKIEANTRFNLEKGPLIKTKIFKFSKEKHVLVLNMHHIISDGWSMGVFVKEFIIIMQALKQGKDPILPALPIQYVDYSVWQRAWLEDEASCSQFNSSLPSPGKTNSEEQTVLKNQLSYWQQKLKAAPEVLNFPTDFVRPSVQSFSGGRYCFSLDQELTSQLKRLAEKQGCTLYMLLLTVFKVMLYRFSNQEDICIGTPVANRHYEGTESLIGMFINTLVLRNQVNGGEPFASLLTKVKATCLDAFENQDVPFEKVVELIQVKRNSSVTPLFQMMCLLQNTPNSSLGGGMKAYPLDLDNSKFDITLVFKENSEKLEGSIEYRSELFTLQTIERMSDCFCTLCEAVVLDPTAKVSELELINAPEKHRLLTSLNQTQADYPQSQCIHELFEQQAKDTPENVAVVFEDRQLTYKSLNEKANQLAHYLVEVLGVTSDTLVGLCVERSLEMVIGVMGILKAGGAYVPLDPSYPQARLDYMIEDAGLTTIVSHAQVSEALRGFTGEVINVDDEEAYQGYCKENMAKSSLGLTSSHLAYVIYTSGSTGKPKGVMVEHRSASNYLASIKSYPHDDIRCSVMSTSLNFDATVTSFFGAWLRGGYLKVLTENRNVFEALSEALQSKINTLFKVTPAHLKGIELSSQVLSRHVVVIGGEALAIQDVNKIAKMLPNSVFINEYGPTEATVGCSAEILERSNLEGMTNLAAISIGRPLMNTQLFLLSPESRLIPFGAIGELYIGGDGLARGYLNRPELTAERFIKNPYYDKTNPSSPERLYRTGDLVRYLPGGNLAFIDRIDDQVKIRGFRIEVGEVESQLSAQAGVDSALVVAKELAGSQQLVAYLKSTHVFDEDAQVSFLAGVKANLLAQLPDYMVPSVIVLVDEWPLTPNGKIDKKALPEPDFSALKGEYVAPQTDTEKALVEIWSELLGIDADKISITANFFELGGHSLLVMTLISKAQQLGLSIEVKSLFTTPNLTTLANVIDNNHQGRSLSSFEAPPNLIPSECHSITPDMLPLVSLTPDEIKYITSQVPGGTENIEDIYPLGPLQAGILYAHKMNKNNDPYVLPMLFEVKKEHAVHNFIKCVEQLIQRHDVLRTLILSDDLSNPVQVVCRKAKLSVSWLELSEDVDAKEYMKEQSLPQNQWLDLAKAPLCQLQIAKGNSEGQFFLLLRLHHIINDHVGLDIMHHELNLISEGKADSLMPVRPYRDFISYTSQQLERNNAKQYFEDLLGDVDEPTTPYGLIDTNKNGSSIIELQESVEDEIAQNIRTLSRKFKFSPASLFHAAFSLVVGACSNKNDVVFGSVMSGRLQGLENSENMLGVFINTLPVRIRIGSEGVLDFIGGVQCCLHDLLAFEQTPLALAQSCSGLVNSTPLFSAMLNYRHTKVQDIGVNSVLSDFKLISSKERNNYPFNLSVDDYGVGFSLDFKVDSSIDVVRVMNYMQTILKQLVVCLLSTPNKPINELSILPEAEQYYLLSELNHGMMDYSKNKCIHELFEQQVQDNPDNVAVVFESEQLTYQELNERANQLAHYLIDKQGVKLDTLVGICVERSLDMVIGILGILKAGGAYVPLDPDYPQARLAYMLDDASLDTVLTYSKLVRVLPLSDTQCVCLDSEVVQAQLAMQPQSNPDLSDLTSDNLAYVTYTSGSTGQPKGVMVEHLSVVRLVINPNFMVLNENTRFLQAAPISFDAATLELWAPLLNGGVSVLYPQAPMDLAVLNRVLDTSKVNALWLTAGLFEQWSEALPELADLRYVIAGGDVLNPLAVKRVIQELPNVSLINGYGPTENTTFTCCYNVSDAAIVPVPIGRAINGTQLYVLNETGQLLPRCVVGELYAGGDGLARGYLGRDDLTAERFIANPFGEGRLYKTGDLVRYLEDGNLAFVGRADNQIKIRGFRVELGEVETQLAQLELVDSALVMAYELAGSQQLVGYIKPSALTSETELTDYVTDVKAKLAQRLPQYMLPSVLMVVDEWPLTPNGKVDRKALPAPDNSVLQGEYVAPATETELQLAEIWAQLLNIKAESISSTANFFELGGHSILVMRMNSMIKQKFGVNLDVSELFFNANIGSIAEVCERFIEKTELEERLSQHDERELEEMEF